MKRDTSECLIDALYIGDFGPRIADALDAGDHPLAGQVMAEAVEAERQASAELDALRESLEGWK